MKMVYRTLAAHLSSAIISAMMVERLEMNYHQLVERAYDEGMADVVSQVMHNIGNVYNSVNASVQILSGELAQSPVPDLLQAELLLRILPDKAGMETEQEAERRLKLMTLFGLLGRKAEKHRETLMAHFGRISRNVRWMDESITIQQGYASGGGPTEPAPLLHLVEDALRVHGNTFERSGITVIKGWHAAPMITVHRGHMFQVLVYLLGALGGAAGKGGHVRCADLADCRPSGKRLHPADVDIRPGFARVSRAKGGRSGRKWIRRSVRRIHACSGRLLRERSGDGRRIDDRAGTERGKIILRAALPQFQTRTWEVRHERNRQSGRLVWGRRCPLTIGFLDENGSDEYHSYLLEGIAEAAAHHHARVVRVGHFITNDTNRDPVQVKMVQRFLHQFPLDGILFLGWHRAVTMENQESFRRRFADLPLYAVGSRQEIYLLPGLTPPPCWRNS